MVPSPHHSGSPCFPGCVNWILDNQLYNGSWGLSEHSDPLLKDALSSTLACILALKKWGVGEQQINKGTDQFLNGDAQYLLLIFNISTR